MSPKKGDKLSAPKKVAEKKTETTDTSADVKEVVKEETHGVESYSGAGVVCVALQGSAQLHVLKPEHEQNPDSGTLTIESRILSLGEFVAEEEIPAEALEEVKNGLEERLQYVLDQAELRTVQLEARTKISEQLVEVDRVYQSAEK